MVHCGGSGGAGGPRVPLILQVCLHLSLDREKEEIKLFCKISKPIQDGGDADAPLCRAGPAKCDILTN